MKQKELSIWLRIVTAVIGLLVVFACAVLAPMFGAELAAGYPEAAYMFAPCMIYVCLAAVPVIIALVFAWIIFTEIGRDNSFCEDNSRRLKYIGHMFFFEAIYIAGGIVALALMGYGQPGIILLMLFGMLCSLGAAVICAALSHLTYKAYLIKKDNDLTI